MTIFYQKKKLVLCSFFLLFIYNSSWYQHFYFSTDSHKAGSHKFDNRWLSLASSYKLVMTFVFGQNIKISIWT
jgi:hypothetical protein